MAQDTKRATNPLIPITAARAMQLKDDPKQSACTTDIQMRITTKHHSTQPFFAHPSNMLCTLDSIPQLISDFPSGKTTNPTVLNGLRATKAEEWGQNHAMDILSGAEVQGFQVVVLRVNRCQSPTSAEATAFKTARLVKRTFAPSTEHKRTAKPLS